MAELRDIFRNDLGDEFHCAVFNEMLLVEVCNFIRGDSAATGMWIPLDTVQYDVSKLGYRIWSDR